MQTYMFETKLSPSFTIEKDYWAAHGYLDSYPKTTNP